jgi:hypothetical protein
MHLRLVLAASLHASGRVQSEQAVQAADVELESPVDITRVQLMQGIHPLLSWRLQRLTRCTKSSATNLIQSLLNTHPITRIDKPLITNSIVEWRKLQNETGVDAQHGTKGVVGGGTQCICILNLPTITHGQGDFAQSFVDSQRH